MPKHALFSIAWHDLTVPNADKVRSFYEAVVGWKAKGFDMGGYQDWAMNDPKTGKTVAGVCWKRGPNRKLPSQWLLYVMVKDLKKSIAACRRKGGKVVVESRDMGPYGTLGVVKDPAGAVMGLMEPPRSGKRGKR
jgi:predicted enzyme related to lactoylglutathione lyase